MRRPLLFRRRRLQPSKPPARVPQHTMIVAPVSGIVGKRSVQPGQNVSPGQQMMTIVPLDSQNIWVTANFKETQLKNMRPGQTVRITVDTYGRTYNGRVLSIAGG